MGMFDKPQYLTGKNGEGFAQAGDTFWLHAAKIDGEVKVGDKTLPQAKLRVSKARSEETVDVYSAGAAIVNQVRRLDETDRASFPIEVRLDQLPSKQGSPMNVLTPANQDPPTAEADSPADF